MSAHFAGVLIASSHALLLVALRSSIAAPACCSSCVRESPRSAAFASSETARKSSCGGGSHVWYLVLVEAAEFGVLLDERHDGRGGIVRVEQRLVALAGGVVAPRVDLVLGCGTPHGRPAVEPMTTHRPPLSAEQGTGKRSPAAAAAVAPPHIRPAHGAAEWRRYWATSPRGPRRVPATGSGAAWCACYCSGASQRRRRREVSHGDHRPSLHG